MYAQLTPSPVVFRPDMAPATLPDALSLKEGHLACCDTEERELTRLRAALDGIGRHPRSSGPDMAEAHGWADSAQALLNRARRAIEAGEFEDMQAHSTTIRFRMNLLREFLVRADALDRSEAAPAVSATRVSEFNTAPRGTGDAPPASAHAGNHRVTPAQFLRSGMTRLAHAVKSAPERLRCHVPFDTAQILRTSAARLADVFGRSGSRDRAEPRWDARD